MRILLLVLALVVLGSTPARAERLTVDDVLALSRKGEAPAQIIEAMRRQGVRYAPFDLQFAGLRQGGPSPGLSGSRLAQLHAQGVDDAVLDALQAGFVAQVLEDARQRYLMLSPGRNR